jgi:predicted anti-sigma-YlaC factor YlaD
MSAATGHLSCRELVEVLTDYLEGATGPEQRADVERHLVYCSGCSSYVEQMRTTVDLLARIADREEPAGGPPEAQLGMFRAWRSERSP